MKFFKNLWTKLFKHNVQAPWLDYYSREERKIKFTDKTIYQYMIDEVGEDKDFYALNYFNNRITYNEFFDNINKCARSLREYGVREGDIVTICMPNMPEALYAVYACNKIGAVADMVHPLSSADQLSHYLKESKSRILFLVDFDYDKFKEILPHTLVYKTILVSPKESMPFGLTVGYTLTREIGLKRPKLGDRQYMSWKEFLARGIKNTTRFKTNMKKDDLAVILHSGGTTGTPKGIMISNYSFNALSQQSAVNVIDVRPKAKIVTILPIFHGFGLGVCVHTPLCLKVETILMPEYDANRFYKIWKNDRPHVILGVPTLWEGMMSNKKFDDVNMSQLKYIVSGGDYLTVPMEERINEFLHKHGARVNIAKGYGMTESVAATAYTFPGTNEPGSIGIPMVGNTYCICDPESHESLPLGQEGEICVQGPTVMMGYLNNPEETDKVLITHSDGTKWLHTGDIGYIKENGIVYYTQRLKRMIIVSGFNVYPSVIEETIAKHEGVAKVCVIGVPHPYKMHVPKAFVVLKEDYKEGAKIKREIRDLCKAHLPVYSVPKDIEFRTELPKTLYNKVDYKKLEKEELEKMEQAKEEE
ncbi:MAG: AMP-binding protein [Bacilli bacterium]|nr:AMP-binding protein [Bacilli bacterium]